MMCPFMVPVSSKLTLLAPGNSWAGAANQGHLKSSSSASAFPMSRLGSWLLFAAQAWMLQVTIPRTGRKMPAGSFAEAAQEIVES